MSVFLHVACPPEQLPLIRSEILPLQLLRSKPSEYVARCLGPSHAIYLVTDSSGEDSCALQDRFPEGPADEAPSEKDPQALVAKYRRKGWSQTKIERALAQRRQPADAPDLGAVLEHALLGSVAVAPMPWIVHWYRFGRDYLDRSRLGELVSIRADRFRLNAASLPEGAVVRIDKVGPSTRTA